MSQSSQKSVNKVNNNGNNNNSTHYRSEEVQFVPHFTTLTDGGKSHFNRIADGLAEFVDNSMEAGKKGNIENTQISINFFIDDKSSKGHSGFCVVSDNGTGMDKDGLKEFATFSLDQNTKRQVNNDDSLGNFISKYGVGAKQAGFYLGSRMRVVTKTKTSSEISMLNLDREEFAKRYEEGKSAFVGNIEYRKAFDEKQLPQEEQKWPRLVDHLKECERNQEHFTYIVIKLETEIVRSLFKDDRYKILSAEIAEIYHFHLHPEHRPSNIIDQFAAKKLDGFQHTKLRDASVDKNGMKLEMFLAVSQRDGTSLLEKQRLNDDERNPIKRFIETAKQAIRFNILVPSPDNSHSQTQDGDHSKGTIEGIIFYFPFDEGETRPDTRPEYSYQTTALLSDPDEDKRPVPTFNTFWVHRLVPASVVRRLAFFPKTKGSLKMGTDKDAPQIPADWMGRIKGFLFFDRDFPITNNKLRIQVDPDIDTWLNDKVKDTQLYSNSVLSYAPRNIQDEFKKWLFACHKTLDRQFILEERDYELERSKKNPKTEDGKTIMFFKKLNILGPTKQIISKDDVVKLQMKVPMKTNGPGTIIGKILTFEVPDLGNSTHDITKAKIRYIRIGDRDSADLTTALQSLNYKEDYKVNKKDMETLNKMSPKHIEVSLFDKKGGPSRLCKNDKNSAPQKVHAGEPIFKIAVQILNGKGEPTFIKHQNLTSNRYKVRLTFDRDGPKPIDFGTTDDVWYYNPDKNEEEKMNELTKKNGGESAYYCFFGKDKGAWTGVTFNRTGKTSLFFEVIDADDKDHVLLTQKIDLLVESKGVDCFTIDFTTVPKQLQLGDGIPEFQVVFRDKLKNVCNYIGKIMTKVVCEDMEVYCLGSKGNKLTNPQWQMDEDDEGKISFINNQWNIFPSKPMFQDSLDPIEKEFNFELYEMPPGRGEQKLLGTETFKLRFSPGLPHSLVLIDPFPEELPLNITGGESIDTITVAVLDEFGNRTAPKGKNIWRLIAEGRQDCHITAKDAPIINTGEGTLRDIKVDADDHISSDGLSTEFAIKLTGVRDAANKDISLPVLHIPLKITASTYPNELRVYYQGSPLIENSAFPCNSVISDLTFRIYDNNQEEIEFSPSVFAGNDSYLDLSWVPQEDRVVKKGRRGSQRSQSNANVTSNNLPDIIIDSKVESPIQEFTIDAVVFGKSNLNTSFRILVSSRPAIAWKIITGPKFADGITSDDANDLKSKVHCLCLVDEFDNVVGVDDSFKPRLFVKSNDPTDDDMDIESDDRISADREIRLIYRSQMEAVGSTAPDRKNKNAVKLPNVNCFIIDHNEFLQAHPTPASVWLYACDEHKRMQSSSQRCIINNGLPSIMKLSSEAMNIRSPEVQPSISVSTFTESILMTLHFQDRSGNDGSSSAIKSGIELIVTVLDSNNDELDVMKVRSIKSVAYPISIPLSEVMNKIDHNANDFVLRFKSSYVLDKETIALEPAQLFCSITKMNAVVGFKAFASCGNSDEFQVVTNNCIEINCSSPLPTIALETITDDGQAFTPPPEDLEVIVSSVGNDSVTIINHVVSFNDNLCIITLTNSSTLQVGMTKITIKYEERRPNLLTVNSNGIRVLEKSIILQVFPDPPSVLKVDQRSAGKLNNLFVSHHQKAIASNVQFVVNDKYENPCSYPTTMQVICRIVLAHQDSDDDIVALPNLQLAANGYIVAKLDKARNTATFNKIEIDNTEIEGDGNFNLEFSVLDSNESNISTIPPVLFPFKIFSNANIEAEVDRIKQKMSPIEDAVSNHKTDSTRLKSEMSKITRDIESLLKSANNGTLKALMIKDVEQDTVENIKSNLEVQKRRFADQTQVRPSKKRESPSHQQLRDIDIIGMVVDLGFVDDYNNAKILSWAAQSYMKSVVVENFDLSKKLYDRGVKSWAISGVIPYEIKNKDFPQGRTRNDSERRAGKLFNFIDGSEMPGGIQGNPEYLAELITLSDESLRDTIFFNVFKRQLLFDNLETAIQYRQWMVKKRKSVPTIYTRTGEKLTQEGQLDPVGGKMPENLDYIFGQSKAQHANDYKYIEQDIETCKKLLNSIVNRTKIKDDLNALESQNEDFESNKQQLAALQAELKALNFKSTKRDSKRGRDSNTLVDDDILRKRASTGGDDDDDLENNHRDRSSSRKRRIDDE